MYSDRRFCLLGLPGTARSTAQVVFKVVAVNQQHIRSVSLTGQARLLYQSTRVQTLREQDCRELEWLFVCRQCN